MIITEHSDPADIVVVSQIRVTKQSNPVERTRKLAVSMMKRLNDSLGFDIFRFQDLNNFVRYLYDASPASVNGLDAISKQYSLVERDAVLATIRGNAFTCAATGVAMDILAGTGANRVSTPPSPIAHI